MPRRRAHVVLEHPQHAVGAAHDVEPGHADVHGLRRELGQARLEVVAALERALGDHAGSDDAAL